jgi:hypothetical protein
MFIREVDKLQKLPLLNISTAELKLKSIWSCLPNPAKGFRPCYGGRTNDNDNNNGNDNENDHRQ